MAAADMGFIIEHDGRSYGYLYEVLVSDPAEE
jgi:hypothetical protein